MQNNELQINFEPKIENLLKKYGWTSGQGLGTLHQGISAPIQAQEKTTFNTVDVISYPFMKGKIFGSGSLSTVIFIKNIKLIN